MAKDLMDLLQLPAVPDADPGSEPPERLLILAIGTRDRVINCIHELHQRGFAHVSAWSPLLPAPSPHEVMSILTRYKSHRDLERELRQR